MKSLVTRNVKLRFKVCEALLVTTVKCHPRNSQCIQRNNAKVNVANHNATAMFLNATRAK